MLASSGGVGGKTGLYFIDLSTVDPKITAYARCLTARYDRGISKRKAESSGTVDFDDVDEQDDKHNVLLIREATKRGYKEAVPGDFVAIGFAGSNTKRGRVRRGIAKTLVVGSAQGVITLCGRIRRLMPRECFRLQGFNEDQIDKLLEVSSDAQAYKQAGNAVTVNVVHALGIRLRKAHTVELMARNRLKSAVKSKNEGFARPIRNRLPRGLWRADTRRSSGRPIASRRMCIVPEFRENPDVEKLGRALISIAKTMPVKKPTPIDVKGDGMP